MDRPVNRLPGVGEKRAQSLRAMGIVTLGDLLNHFPRDYDDRSQVKTVSMLTPGAVNTIRFFMAGEGENIAYPAKAGAKRPGRPLVMTKLKLRDHTGELELIWFNQPYLKQYFKKGREYIFTGRVHFAYNRMQMESPDYELVGEAALLSGGRIVPVYTLPASLSQKTFRVFVKAALDVCVDSAMTDNLPEAIRHAYALCARKAAIQHIHFPQSDEHFLAARRRLVFEELFFMQSALLKMKGIVSAEPGTIFQDINYEPFLAQLPFTPTQAQAAVLDTLAQELTTGNRINRLIQGDVGSGKTAVAMAVAYLSLVNRHQAAIMAPTEVLAGQHYRQFDLFLTPLGFKTVLLTGSLRPKERAAALTAIQDGSAHMVVGTHALIMSGVAFNDLALVITDEQHRFGVNQRSALSGKGSKPHVLVMTATPIPRTLGLILYGDMDISVINELPPGRQTIKTYCVNSSYRERLRTFLRKEAEQGRQAYVICPAIEAAADGTEVGNESGAYKAEAGSNAGGDGAETGVRPSKAAMQSVLAYAAALQTALPDIRVACLHGRMTPAEKQSVMDDFTANTIQILVATTVVEVGVHVANATLMIIEDADRFGLSQLHQLRGRVGRGEAQSYCVLVSDSRNEQTRARMKAMEQTTDGFKLSEMDLELRGAGDFFGTQQHGLPAFTIANLYRDMDILKEAQTAAVDVFERRIALNAHEAALFDRCVEDVFRATRGTVAL